MGTRSGTRQGARQPHFSEVQVEEVRRLLLAAIAQEYTEFERQEAVVTADWPGDFDGLDRASAALRMFGARVAIGAIADALDRIDDGGFGLCVSCARPIPFPLLEADPLARCCVDCAESDADEAMYDSDSRSSVY